MGVEKVIYQAKPNILWFHHLKCQHLLLFFYNIRLWLCSYLEKYCQIDGL